MSKPTSSSQGASAVRIETLADKARLAEFMVEKRSKFLQYLVQLHSNRQSHGAAVVTPPLWMGAIRLHRAEILRHFLVPEELVREDAVTVSETAVDASLVTLFPAVTLGGRVPSSASRSNPSTPSLAPAPPSFDASRAAGSPAYPVAEASWVREHCTRWAVLGACLPSILQAPLFSPPDAFIDAFYQLLLEIDVFLEGTDTAAKLLSIRALKTYRSERFSWLKKSKGARDCQETALAKGRQSIQPGSTCPLGAQDAFLQIDADGGNAPVIQMMSRRYNCQAHAAAKGVLRHVRGKAAHNLPCDDVDAHPSMSVAEMVEEERHVAYNATTIEGFMGATAENALPLAAFHSALPQRKQITAAMGLGTGGTKDLDPAKSAVEEWDRALEGVEGSFLETKGYFKYHFLDLEAASFVVGGSTGRQGNQNPTASPKRVKDGDAPEGAMPSASGKGPSYDVVTPALCKVLITAYNKLADFSALEEPNAVETILAIDKKLKHDFFGALSRQLGSLAQAKLRQQALFLTDGIFGSYSSAGRGIGAWLPQEQLPALDDDE